MRWAVLLLVPLLAGCSSSTFAPETMYAHADHRVADVAIEAFEEYDQITLPGGAMTLMVSVDAPDGFGVFLNAPQQREPYSGMMLPGPRHGFVMSANVSIQDLRFIVEGAAGQWGFNYGCHGPCSYTIAIDHNDTIPETPRLLRTAKLASAQGQLEDDRVESVFKVPRTPGVPRVAMDFISRDAISIGIWDGADNKTGNWHFGKAYARGFSYGARDDAVAGQWRTSVGCDGRCDFDVGVRAR